MKRFSQRNVMGSKFVCIVPIHRKEEEKAICVLENIPSFSHCVRSGEDTGVSLSPDLVAMYGIRTAASFCIAIVKVCVTDSSYSGWHYL